MFKWLQNIRSIQSSNISCVFSNRTNKVQYIYSIIMRNNLDSNINNEWMNKRANEMVLLIFGSSGPTHHPQNLVLFTNINTSSIAVPWVRAIPEACKLQKVSSAQKTAQAAICQEKLSLNIGLGEKLDASWQKKGKNAARFQECAETWSVRPLEKKLCRKCVPGGDDKYLSCSSLAKWLNVIHK